MHHQSTQLRLLLFALLAMLAVPITAQDSDIPGFEPLEECFVLIPEGADYDCGYIMVPEFHEVSTDNTLQLGVIRLRSTSENPGAPVFFGAGGPGGSVMQWAGAAVSDAANNPEGTYAQLLAERDLIYFTQRGTQYAEPFLFCEEEAEAQDELARSSDYDEHLRLEIEMMTACRDRLLADGVNFNAFDSLENAADVNMIREIFGYDQIVFYGESYGTILGQHIMRDFPDTLESVILDGTASLSITNWEADSALKYDITLDRLVELCQQDELCNRFYPDFATDLEAIYEQAETAPLQVTQILEDGELLDVDITPEVLSSTLYTILYSIDDIPSFPRMAQELLDGNTSTFQQFFNLASSAFSEMGTMMHAAVVCSEDPVSADTPLPEGDDFYSVAIEHQREGVNSYSAICDIIAVEPIIETDETVTNDLPVLVISGALDPATPNYSSDEVAAALPNSTTVLFPYGSHVQVRPFTTCASSIMAQFIANPEGELDTSCIASESPLRFTLPTPTPEALVGLTLSLTRTAIEGDLQDYEGDEVYTLTISEEMLTVQADCATFDATYAIADDSTISIDFDEEAVTDCGEDSLAATVVPFLAEAGVVSLLYNDDGTVTMILFDEDFDTLTFAE